MKETRYQGNGLPNNCGLKFIIPDQVSSYLLEILGYFKNRVFGTVFDSFNSDRTGNGKENSGPNRFKMGESKFIQPLELKQTIKYGAALYLVAALVALPGAICSSSYQAAFVATSPTIAPPQVPAVIAVLNDSAPVQSAGDESAADRGPGERADPQQAPVAPPFHSHILRASQTYEVDASLIRAIIMAESSNNPRAVSHRGAQGLMQLMPTTAKWLGVEDAFDPALNIDGGVRYFKRLLDRFSGDIELALAAYNAGSRYVRKYGGVPPFRATRIYIKKVLEYQRAFQRETASTHAGSTMS